MVFLHVNHQNYRPQKQRCRQNWRHGTLGRYVSRPPELFQPPVGALGADTLRVHGHDYAQCFLMCQEKRAGCTGSFYFISCRASLGSALARQMEGEMATFHHHRDACLGHVGRHVVHPDRRVVCLQAWQLKRHHAARMSLAVPSHCERSHLPQRRQPFLGKRQWPRAAARVDVHFEGPHLVAEAGHTLRKLGHLLPAPAPQVAREISRTWNFPCESSCCYSHTVISTRQRFWRVKIRCRSSVHLIDLG